MSGSQTKLVPPLNFKGGHQFRTYAMHHHLYVYAHTRMFLYETHKIMVTQLILCRCDRSSVTTSESLDKGAMPCHWCHRKEAYFEKQPVSKNANLDCLCHLVGFAPQWLLPLLQSQANHMPWLQHTIIHDLEYCNKTVERTFLLQCICVSWGIFLDSWRPAPPCFSGFLKCFI